MLGKVQQGLLDTFLIQALILWIAAGLPAYNDITNLVT